MGKKQTLGDRLQILLDEYNLSPDKLAGLVGMSGVSIRSILKDESNPYQSTLEKIASALGSTYEYLVHGTGDKLPNGKKQQLSPLAGGSPNQSDPWRDVALNQVASERDNLKSEVARLWSMIDDFRNGRLSFLMPVKEVA